MKRLSILFHIMLILGACAQRPPFIRLIEVQTDPTAVFPGHPAQYLGDGSLATSWCHPRKSPVEASTGIGVPVAPLRLPNPTALYFYSGAGTPEFLKFSRPRKVTVQLYRVAKEVLNQSFVLRDTQDEQAFDLKVPFSTGEIDYINFELDLTRIYDGAQPEILCVAEISILDPLKRH